MNESAASEVEAGGARGALGGGAGGQPGEAGAAMGFVVAEGVGAAVGATAGTGGAGGAAEALGGGATKEGGGGAGAGAGAAGRGAGRAPALLRSSLTFAMRVCGSKGLARKPSHPTFAARSWSKGSKAPVRRRTGMCESEAFFLMKSQT